MNTEELDKKARKSNEQVNPLDDPEFRKAVLEHGLELLASEANYHQDPNKAYKLDIFDPAKEYTEEIDKIKPKMLRIWTKPIDKKDDDSIDWELDSRFNLSTFPMMIMHYEEKLAKKSTFYTGNAEVLDILSAIGRLQIPNKSEANVYLKVDGYDEEKEFPFGQMIDNISFYPVKPSEETNNKFKVNVYISTDPTGFMAMTEKDFYNRLDALYKRLQTFDRTILENMDISVLHEHNEKTEKPVIHTSISGVKRTNGALTLFFKEIK